MPRRTYSVQKAPKNDQYLSELQKFKRFVKDKDPQKMQQKFKDENIGEIVSDYQKDTRN